jgi:hypothetical protein
MMDMGVAVKELLEKLADEQIDPALDARIQDLMDRNNFGELSEQERAELAAHVATNKRWTIYRGLAMVALGRKVG